MSDQADGPVPAGWRTDAAGLCEQATQRASPNCDERPDPADITLAIVHSISLPPGVYGGDHIERLFTNCLDWDAHPYFQTIRGLQVSSHFLIRRDGRLLQFVPTLRRAWHAGQSIWRGRPRCNDYSIGIELEGLEGQAFEAVQYPVLAALLASLRQRHPLTNVVGHEHVAPGRKIDPGPGFDWRRLQAALAWPDSCFAAVDRRQASGSEGAPAEPSDSGAGA